MKGVRLASPHLRSGRLSARLRWLKLQLAMIALFAPSLLASADADAARGPRAAHLIVKFRSEGEAALAECAETLFRRHASFAGATADASDSLDRLQAELGVRKVRALFRRPDGRPLAEQRAKLNQRMKANRARSSARRRAGSRRSSSHPRAGQGAPADSSVDSPTAALLAGAAPDLAHIYRIEVATATSVGTAVESYRDDPHVEWAQIDHTNVIDSFPDDPFLSSSGSWGQSFEDLWGLHRVRAPEAWEISTGEGVIVAVVDTGLDYEHPDMAENVWVNPGEDLNSNGLVDPSDWNGADDDGNGFVDDLRGFDFANSIDVDDDGAYDGPEDVNDPDPFDDNGHGTHVSGTIAALGNNGLGVIGVAPAASIMPLKGFPADGAGLDSVLWSAVLYAVENGASVVNNSWSCAPACPRNPLAEEVVAIAHAFGVVIVTSAGNGGMDLVRNSPEKLRETIAVSSIGQDGAGSDFSNVGWFVDVAAPGGGPADDSGAVASSRNILSLRSSADEASRFYTVGGPYYRSRGTSMSSPHVAGGVALLRSFDPSMSYEEVRRRLRLGAKDAGVPGHDRVMGAGVLDLYASLSLGDLPDMQALITAPTAGSIFRDNERGIEVVGTAAGDDMSSYTLSLGRGTDPLAWLKLVDASVEPVIDGVLGVVTTDDLDQGSHVVKLEVHSIGGAVYEEFTQLSLEWNEPVQISTSGAGATRPAISQPLVVWSSRRNPEDPEEGADALSLFITDLETGLEYGIRAGPANRRDASISGRLLSWLDSAASNGPGEMSGCRFDPRTGECPEFVIAPGRSFWNRPWVAAGRIFWNDIGPLGGEIRGCLPDPSRGDCEPFDLGLSPTARNLLTSDGETLVWFNESFRGPLGICEPDAATGVCQPSLTARRVLAGAWPTASKGNIAWMNFEGLSGALHICHLDLETGKCPRVKVVEDIVDIRPRLSGHRLVWEASVDGEESDIFFCEFDPALRQCPVQRLTAEPSVQTESVVDGTWVAWVDDRAGASQIFGTELPSMTPIADRSVAEGGLLRVRVGAHDPSRRPVELQAELIGRLSLVDLGIRFHDNGHGRGRLRWRPSFEQAGSYRIEVAATTEGQLVTRRSFQIEVQDTNRPPRAVLEVTRSRRLGQPAVLDACASFDPDGDSLSFTWYGSLGDILGKNCRVEVASPSVAGWRSFELSITDGEIQRGKRVWVRWRRNRFSRWRR